MYEVARQFFLGYWPWMILAIGFVYTVLDCFALVPAVHYGVRERFKGQLPGVRKEGLNFKLPFIDKMKNVPLELKSAAITVEFTTKDKLRVKIPGSLQYRADPAVVELDTGRNVFFRLSEAAITTGIEKDVQAKLGGIGGWYDGDKFIENRQALSDLINSIFRLDVPFHLRHVPGIDVDAGQCGVASCGFPEQVDADRLIDFYNRHWRRVKGLLDHERYEAETRSDVEKRYGLDISTYSLAEVTFTPETQAAQEEKRQADYRAEAGDKIIALAKKTKVDLPEIPDQQALNWADATLNPGTPRQMISVEGEAGVAGGLLALVPKKGGK